MTSRAEAGWENVGHPVQGCTGGRQRSPQPLDSPLRPGWSYRSRRILPISGQLPRRAASDSGNNLSTGSRGVNRPLQAEIQITPRLVDLSYGEKRPKCGENRHESLFSRGENRLNY